MLLKNQHMGNFDSRLQYTGSLRLYTYFFHLLPQITKIDERRRELSRQDINVKLDKYRNAMVREHECSQ